MFLGFFLCHHFRNHLGGRNKGGSVVNVEQRVLAEMGELCHKPSANQSITIVLNTGCVITQELVFAEITFILRQSSGRAEVQMS